MGSIMVPKEWMSEKDIREFIPSIIGDPEQAAIWREKAEKDPITDLIEWLRMASYVVTES